MLRGKRLGERRPRFQLRRIEPQVRDVEGSAVLRARQVDPLRVAHRVDAEDDALIAGWPSVIVASSSWETERKSSSSRLE